MRHANRPLAARLKDVGVAIGLAAILAVPGPALRATEKASVEATEKPIAAADHSALAEQYRKEAVDLRKQAARHRLMLRAYEKEPSYDVQITRAAMVKHCLSLIDHYTRGAEEADAMAQRHLELAGRTREETTESPAGAETDE